MAGGTRGQSTRLGAEAEDLAVRHLEGLGYRVVARNYRAGQGEIDIIALQAGTLCFVEVRSRGNAGYGAPAETVSRAKRRRIASAAACYLAARGEADVPCRFDVVAIDGERHVTVIADAFRLEDC